MFAKTIKILAAVFTGLTVCAALLYQYCPVSWILSVAITFGTFAYHFLMRLLVGGVVDGIFHNQFDPNAGWFREKTFEKRLYQVLRVKKWKSKIPSFAPELMDNKVHTWEEIAGAMCQSEVVHTIIAVLSFLPIMATAVWGSFWVFFITSLLAAGIECMLVILQRYNRPRIMKILLKIEKRYRENK